MTPKHRPTPVMASAHEVVGLYGDPDSTWGIGLVAELAVPQEAAVLEPRLRRLVEQHPHFGAEPELVVADLDLALATLLVPTYGAGAPLLRAALSPEGTRLLLAAHHGATDGLGLIAVLGTLLASEPQTSATGVSGRRPRHSFLVSSGLRVIEAVVSPPPRFTGTGTSGAVGENITVLVGDQVRLGTARLAAEVLGTHRELHGPTRRPAVLAIGASTRATTRLVPDRQTAFLRLRAGTGTGIEAIRSLMTRADPEPAFPETSAAGIGPRVVGLLKSRLGATATVSNIGVIEVPGVIALTLYPALSGPRAVAVGAASTAERTSISVRTRARDFTPAEHQRIAEALASAVFGATGYRRTTG